MKKFLVSMKKYFIIFITVLSYLFLIDSFFIREYWLMSTVYIMIFYIFIHYFFIELKTYWLRTFIYIILTGAFLQMFIIWFENFFKIISMYTLNIWFIYLIVDINSEINNRKTLSSWAIFNSWVWMFSLFLALAYSFMFIGIYDKFNLTCGTLYDHTNKFIDFVSKPLSLSMDEAWKVKKSLWVFYDSKVKDIIWINLNLSWNWLFSGKNISWFVLPDLVTWKDNKKLVLTGVVSTWAKDIVYEKWILWKIEKMKVDLIKTFSDKKNVDSWICSYTIEQIASRYEKPSFKFSVITLLFFLLWPFMRIIFFIISVLNLLIFAIARLLKVYKFQYVLEEVEELE